MRPVSSLSFPVAVPLLQLTSSPLPRPNLENWPPHHQPASAFLLLFAAALVLVLAAVPQERVIMTLADDEENYMKRTLMDMRPKHQYYMHEHMHGYILYLHKTIRL